MPKKAKARQTGPQDPKKESGDYLGDDFVAGGFSDGEEEDAVVAASALEDDDSNAEKDAGKKRKTLDILREKKKKAKNGAPKREDACAVGSAAEKEQSQFFLQHLKSSEFGHKLSDIQMQDAARPTNFIQLKGKSGDASLEQLSHHVGQHASAPDGNTSFPGAAPLVVIVVSSGEQGAKVWNALASLNKESPVIKAFGNHPKVKKALQKFLESPKSAESRVVVGTAGRLLKLFQQGSLLSDRLGLFLVDMNPDSKGRTLMDMKECKDDVMQLLLSLLFPRLLDASLRIAFY